VIREGDECLLTAKLTLPSRRFQLAIAFGKNLRLAPFQLGQGRHIANCAVQPHAHSEIRVPSERSEPPSGADLANWNVFNCPHARRGEAVVFREQASAHPHSNVCGPCGFRTRPLAHRWLWTGPCKSNCISRQGAKSEGARLTSQFSGASAQRLGLPRTVAAQRSTPPWAAA
jgi:hypothetical protein